MGSFSQTKKTVFQSTHPVRGATSCEKTKQMFGVISIHAPREGCDINYVRVIVIVRYFNPRTP